MKKLSLALLLTACSVSNAATITPSNPYEDTKPPTICAQGVLALATQVVKEPKKIFGERGGDPISLLTGGERARIFSYTNLSTDKEGPEEALCSISISISPQLDEGDKSKLETIYPPIRVQFKISKGDGDQIVSPVSFKKIIKP